MKNFTLVLSLCFLANQSYGDEDSKNDPLSDVDLQVRPENRPIFAKTTGPEFAVDSNLVDKLFKESSQRKETNSRLNVGVGVGQMFARDLTLANKYYEIDHTKGSPRLTFGSLTARGNLLESAAVHVQGYALGGYSRQESIQNLVSDGYEVKDNVSLQWAFLQSGVLLHHPSVASSWVKPLVQCGVGMDWLSQEGTIDGVSQSFLLPEVSAGPALVFFSGGKNSVGFDGLTLSSYYRTTLEKTQTFRGWAVALDGQFNL